MGRANDFLSKLILEPNLLTPNEKPTGDVELNRDLANTLGVLRYYPFLGASDPDELITGNQSAWVKSSAAPQTGVYGQEFALGSNSGNFYTADDDYRSAITSQLTAWVDLTHISRAGINNFAFGNVGTSASDYNWGFYPNSATGRYIFYVKTAGGGTSTSTTLSPTYSANERKLLIATYDGANIKIYESDIFGNVTLSDTTAKTGNVNQTNLETAFNRWVAAANIRSNYHSAGVANKCWSLGQIQAFARDRYKLLKPKSSVIFPQAAAGGVSGTLAFTLDDITAAMTGVVEVTGTLATTIDSITVAASGTFTSSSVTGTLAITLDSITPAFQGVVEVTGSLSATLDSIAVAFSGSVTNAVTGTFDITLDGIGFAATGTIGGWVIQTKDDTIWTDQTKSTDIWTLQ